MGKQRLLTADDNPARNINMNDLGLYEKLWENLTPEMRENDEQPLN